MTRAGNLLHEFLPVDEMFDCAEAIIRVFHRLGDYKHKQKNRLKFLVRSLGWDGFVTEYERERADLGADHGGRAAVRSRASAGRRCADAAPNAPLALAEIAARATPTPSSAPASCPKVEPRLVVHSREFLDWSSTNVRPQKQDGLRRLSSSRRCSAI